MILSLSLSLHSNFQEVMDQSDTATSETNKELEKDDFGFSEKKKKDLLIEKLQQMLTPNRLGKEDRVGSIPRNNLEGLKLLLEKEHCFEKKKRGSVKKPSICQNINLNPLGNVEYQTKHLTATGSVYLKQIPPSFLIILFLVLFFTKL